MPLYMDLHILPGVKAREVAEAHRRDLLIQDDHRCNCMTYWIDEKRGNVFCLIEAPDRIAVSEMHRKAHGLIPHKIIEVNSRLVESFLGRISDPDDAVMMDGFKVFSDESRRSLMVIKMPDPVLLKHALGEKAGGIQRSQHYIIHKELTSHEGNEVKQGGDDYTASFASAANAIRCAVSVRDVLAGMSPENAAPRFGIYVGDPVAISDDLFGDAIQMAGILGGIAKEFEIALSAEVREMASRDRMTFDDPYYRKLSAADEQFLQQLFQLLEAVYQDPAFSIDDCGQRMAMSNSQLYRRTVALTGLTPGAVLKNLRLQKARQLLRRGSPTIAQITYDTGFASPSYFTKVFKKEYGLLPVQYLELHA